jgi:beta-glucosidase
MSHHREKARALLKEMRLEEKIAQLHAVWLIIEENGEVRFRPSDDVVVAGSEEDPYAVLHSGIGQITRPLGTRPIDVRRGVRGLNAVQKYLVERTRLHIPALFHEECLPGVCIRGATLFPAALNYASMWDEQLMEQVAAAIGEELHSVGARQGLAPVLDVSRDVRWGRTEETFGEDPYLAGCMAVAYVKGLQGGDLRVLATLKHFAGHSFSEGGRNHAPVHIGERELNDVFLLPFEMAVKLAKPGAIMPAYHDIDGEPVSASRRLCTELLRQRWAFDGLIVSDYEAVRLLATHHHVAVDDAEASALALKAGIDMELPGFTCFRRGIAEALRRGMLSMAAVDAAVMRVLEAKSRLGLFEKPYADMDAVQIRSTEHVRLAARAAAQSIVLLKNDGLLPLRDEGTTALIGPLADERLAFFGGYSFPVHLLAARLSDDADRTKTLLEAVTQRARRGAVIYARGCRILHERLREVPVFPDNPAAANGQPRDCVSHDGSEIEAACAVAARADRIVVAVGDLAGLFLTGTVGEGSDVSTLTLPGLQQQLLDALLSLGKPLVVVMLNGRPYHLGEAFARSNAVVEAWLPGQEGAETIAGVLFGDINPGGRLPISFPKSAGALPYYYNHSLKTPGTPVQAEFGSSFAFGYGISYTTFAYTDFYLPRTETSIDGDIEVGCTLRNTGQRRGDEVVQLYIRDLYSSLVRPLKELKGFYRLSLDAGEAASVTFTVPVDLLSFSDNGFQRVVEPGDFELMIGRSSRDIVFRATVRVRGRRRHLPPDWRMRTLVRIETGQTR